MRQDSAIEGALPVKHHVNARNNKNKKGKKIKAQMENIQPTTTRAKLETKKKNPILPVNIVVENLIRISNAGEDLTPSAPNATGWGMKLSYAKTKISNMVKRHRLLIKREDQLFMATCFSSMESSESWLIDNGCTNHMIHDKDLFRKLRSTNTSKVRIGNG